MDEDDQYLILLAYLENPKNWTERTLQDAIISVIDLVNQASDITGIYAAGLMVDKWGDDPVISFFVMHDNRWDTPEDADTMIIRTFSKAIEICNLDEEMFVLDYQERELLDTE